MDKKKGESYRKKLQAKQEELQKLVGIVPGSPYDANATTLGVQRLRDLYLRLGYPAVRVTPDVRTSGSDLVLVFRIAEGQPVRTLRIRVRVDGSGECQTTFLVRESRDGDVIVVRDDQGEGYEGYERTQVWIADLAQTPGDVAATKITRVTPVARSR